MPLQLFSNEQALLTQIQPPSDSDKLIVLLTMGQSALLPALQDALSTALSSDVGDQLLAVDVGGPTLSRLNFDVVQTAILDLPLDALLSSAGRRLVEVLGRLATGGVEGGMEGGVEEELTLVLVGDAVGVSGQFLPDGTSAGLNLLPGTVALPDVQRVPNLRNLLSTLAEQKTRLLALDGSIAASYDYANDLITVGDSADAAGSVLLAAFVQDEKGTPTARLQVLQPGAVSSWPDR